MTFLSSVKRPDKNGSRQGLKGRWECLGAETALDVCDIRLPADMPTCYSSPGQISCKLSSEHPHPSKEPAAVRRYFHSFIHLFKYVKHLSVLDPEQDAKNMGILSTDNQVRTQEC